MAARYTAADVATWQRQAHKQMPLVRMLAFMEHEWKLLDVPRHRQCLVRGRTPSPVLLAPGYWRHLSCPTHASPTCGEVHAAMHDAVDRCTAWDPDTSGQKPANDPATVATVDIGIALNDWHFLRDALSTNPDCAQRAEVPQSAVDVLQLFATDDMPHDNIDADMRGPHPEVLERWWRDVAIDAVTVHVQNAKEIDLTLPVATDFLLPN